MYVCLFVLSHMYIMHVPNKDSQETVSISVSLFYAVYLYPVNFASRTENDIKKGSLTKPQIAVKSIHKLYFSPTLSNLKKVLCPEPCNWPV